MKKIKQTAEYKIRWIKERKVYYKEGKIKKRKLQNKKGNRRNRLKGKSQNGKKKNYE